MTCLGLSGAETSQRGPEEGGGGGAAGHGRVGGGRQAERALHPLRHDADQLHRAGGAQRRPQQQPGKSTLYPMSA